MAALLLAAPGDAAAQRLRRALGDTGELPTLVLKDLAGLPDALAGRRWSVLIIDQGFETAEIEAAWRLAAEQAPATVRVLVTDRDAAGARTVQGAHQTVPVSDEPRCLAAVLDAALTAARQLADSPRLAGLMARFDKIPSPPNLYFELRAAVASRDGDVERISQVAARDPALVAEVLKVANSGFYGVPRSVTDLEDAIHLVGTDTLTSLVLAAHVFSGMPPPGMRLEVLWQHSGRVAMLARQIVALDGGNRRQQAAATVAGMLHDLGLIVLLHNDAVNYQPMWRNNAADEQELARLERESYGLTHGELGALVLDLWTLPEDIVNAVRVSHEQDRVPSCCVERAVMAAEWLLDSGGSRPLTEDDLPPSLGGAGSEELRAWLDVRDTELARVA